MTERSERISEEIGFLVRRCGQETLSPPKAEKRVEVLEKHGHRREDPYFWMNQREDPQLEPYLQQENAYCEQFLGTEEACRLRERLVAEMKGRIPEIEISAHVVRNHYAYWSEQRVEWEYPVYYRQKVDGGGQPEVLLDVNLEAKDVDYFEVSNWCVSDDNRYLAWAVDVVGRRQYQIRVRDLQTGKDLPYRLEEMSADLAWSADGQWLFLVKKDPETLREHKVLRAHFQPELASAKTMETVFEEQDNTCYVSVYRSKSKKFIEIAVQSTMAAEVLFLDAEEPESTPHVLISRGDDHLYDVIESEDGKTLFVLTNEGAPNYRIIRVAREHAEDREQWEVLVPHLPHCFVGDFMVFSSALAWIEREDGLDTLRTASLEGERCSEQGLYPRSKRFAKPAEASDMSLSQNPSYDASVVRVGYRSMIQPAVIWDVDLQSHQVTLVKEKEVVGYVQDHYRTERIWIEARDGEKIPVSLVYRLFGEEEQLSGPRPTLLYAYGSYGISLPLNMSAARLSLLDRGFVYVIAHVRGSQTLGREWYEAGKLGRKWNTFHDFIDCGNALIQRGITSSQQLFAMGGSAGGLLMGVVLNEAPSLFRGIVAAVPFVDVVTTMLDDSIPLTTFEYDEWGNPEREEDYHYMLSYSPYDQVAEKVDVRPALLVTAGLHDSQVQYWEPAKWVAKLRDARFEDEEKARFSPVFLRMDMQSGHGGKSGRLEDMIELAVEYAFLLGWVEA